MTDKNTDQTATACQKTPTDTERRHAFIAKHGVTGGTLESRKAQHSPLPRLTEAEAKENMRGAYITLADGRTQYCEHLSERERKAVNHADKLAEAGERLKLAVSDLINEQRTLEIEHYAETALHEWKEALQAYEEAKQ